jgi:hypothetical protein
MVSAATAVKAVHDSSPLLLSCFPTLAKNSTTLNYALAKPSDVHIELKSIVGKTMLNIEKKSQKANSYHQSMDLTTMPAGLYFCSVRAGNHVETIKLIKQ